MTAASAQPDHGRPSVELVLVLHRADGTRTQSTLGHTYSDPDADSHQQVAQMLRAAAEEFAPSRERTPLTPGTDG